MNETCHFQSLFDAINEQTLILTPNARLTKTLSEQYLQTQQQTVLPKPNIQPLSNYLAHLYLQLSAISEQSLAPLLTEQQDSLIWLELLKEATSQLYNLPLFAENLKQARKHCLAWQLSFDEPLFDDNKETLFFKTICQDYLAKRGHAITSHELIEPLIMAVENHQLQLPAKIIFALFDDFTPQQQSLITCLTSTTNTEVEYYDTKIENPNAALYQAQTEEQEVLALIHWLKAQLATAQSIGVAIPNLANIRDPLERTLLAHFPPEAFNISMGRSLTQYPLVNSAIAFLSLPKTKLSLAQLHLICHSTFIKGALKEQPLRHSLYNNLRNSTEPYFFSSTISQLLKGSNLAKILPHFFMLLHQSTSTTLANWSSRFIEGLELLGFPGDSNLSSEEYQLHVRLFKALQEFATLNKEQNYHLAEALSLLKWSLNNITFQPKAAQQAPIQILGLLESLGLPFDCLWVMGMDEKQLPQKLSPSPFIPLQYQRDRQMPHACQQREQAISQKHINRLKKHSQTIIFSYSSQHQDEQRAPCIYLKSLSNAQPPSDSVPNHKQTKPLEPYIMPLNLPLDGASTHGGSYLLKEIAQCPFRAFAKYRLKLAEPRQTNSGLDSLDRGVLVHQLMELFWRSVKTQQNLKQLVKKNELTAELEKHIEQAVASVKKKKAYTCNKLFLSLEKSRLKKVALKYLDIELARPTFEVIHIEFETQITINHFELNLRIDRIDQLENGDWLIIDYKTGSPSVNGWLADPITDPQMPIYALTDKRIQALLFAQLQQRDIKNKGIAAEDYQIKGLVPIDKKAANSWQEQLATWHEQISTLIQSYQAGDISPSPHSEAICIDCDYKTLCPKFKDFKVYTQYPWV